MLEFASGAIGVVETSWLGPEAGIVTDDALSVIGVQGSARLDLSQAPLTIRTKRGVVVPDSYYSPEIDGDVAGAFQRQMLAFVQQLRQPGRLELVPMAEVRHGLEVALAVIRSSEEGKAVAIATAPAD
jgi:predicted dehydrogenase